MKKLLVSIEERRWIAANAVVEMGSKIKLKVMDLDVVVEKIVKERKNEAMTPWVEVQPIHEDQHKNRSNLATFVKDPLTGVYYGIPVDQDDFGNIRWQKIQLQDGMSLNLDKRDDARIWAVLRFHPSVQGSPWQEQNPYYKIYDPIEQARAERGEIDAMKLAFDRIDKILSEPKAMVNFARYLGEELMDNSNFEIVRGRLLAQARNYPYNFNKHWENKTRSYGEYFESARALGVISNEVDRGFLYKGIALGFSREEAIKYLSQDNTLMTSISNELSEKDTVIQNVSASVRKSMAQANSQKKEEEKVKEDFNE